MIGGLLIGAGYFAQYQLEAWTRVSGAELLGVVDLDQDKAASLAAPYGLPTFCDTAEAIDALDPDFLDIATPPPSHGALVDLAIDRGLHVICQKPLADSFEEAVVIATTAEASEIRFMVHENWRWQPWYRTIKQVIDDGTVGEPFGLSFVSRVGDGWQEDAYLARQPYFRKYPRLLLHESGVHFIDTFRYLFGEVSSVYAVTNKRNAAIAGEDAAIVVLTFASEVTATLDASRYNENHADDPRFTFGELRLDTSAGHVELDVTGSLLWKRLGQPPEVLMDAPEAIGFGGDSVRRLQQHFVDRLEDGKPFESGGTDYLKTLRVVEACYRSAKTGGVIQLKG